MNRHSLQLSVLPEALQASNSILIIQFFPKPFSIEMRSSFSIREPCSSHEDLAIVDRKNCSDRNSFPVGFLRFCLLLGGQQACTGSCQILLTPNMAKSPCPHQADTAHHFCKSKHPCLPPHPCPSLQRVCAAQLKIRPYPGQCFRRQTQQTHFCKLDKRQNVLPTYTRKFNVDEKSFFSPHCCNLFYAGAQPQGPLWASPAAALLGLLRLFFPPFLARSFTVLLSSHLSCVKPFS